MKLRASALVAAASFAACRGPAPSLSPPPEAAAPRRSGAPAPLRVAPDRSPPPPLALAPSLPIAPNVNVRQPTAAAAPTTSAAAEEPVGPKPRAAGRAAPKRAAKPAVVGQLNLNRATEAELRLLPGIGKGRAKAIVERRRQRPFGSLDEVARIRGLKSIVRRLRPHLTLEGPTTLRPAGLTRPREARRAGPLHAAVVAPKGALEGSRSNAGAVPPL